MAKKNHPLNLLFNRFIGDSKISVGWILSGNEKIGSARIHGLNLHHGLKDAGIRSYLLQVPDEWTEKLDLNLFEKTSIRFSKIDVVIFQRVYGSDATELCRSLQRRGTLCGFFMADIYPSDLITEVDFIITPSDFLKQILEKEGVPANKVFVLPDAIETAPAIRKSYQLYNPVPGEKLKIVWVGIQGHWETLDPIRLILEKNAHFQNYELVTISNHPEADISWLLDTVWDEILACDIGIVPVDLTNKSSLAKSNNRVSMFMALAMPVICSPIPSYSEIIDHRKNGFLASDETEWVKFLLELNDPVIRKKIGAAAHGFAHSNFSRKAISKRLVGIINEIKS